MKNDLVLTRTDRTDRTDQANTDAQKLRAAQVALSRGEFGQALENLAGVAPSSEGWRIHGAALLGAGRILEAETPIRTALALGSSEARLEYGLWLLACGQLAQAAWWLAELGAELPHGEVRSQAQQAHAQVMFELGLPQRALALAQATGHELTEQQAAPQQLAQLARLRADVHLFLGQPRRAYELARQAVAALADEADPLSHFWAWHTLARAQRRLSQPEDARLSLELARQSLTPARSFAGQQPPEVSPRFQALRLVAQIDTHHLAGELEAARAALSELSELSGLMRDHRLRHWTGLKTAEILSAQGQHARAVDAVSSLGTHHGLPPRLRILRGILMRRQRHDLLAQADLGVACEIRDADPLLYWRSQLHLADTHRRLGQLQQASATLEYVLRHLQTCEDCAVYAPDIDELAELVVLALLDPERSPLMEAVQARLRGEAWASESALPLVEVCTLGRAAVKRDGQAVAGLSSGAVLMLTYLALHPAQSRNAMQAVLFPDFDRRQTARFFRVAVRELRSGLGPDILELDDTLRHPRYRVSGEVQVSLDLTELKIALSAGDLAQAARLYRGAFLAELEAPDTWNDEGYSEQDDEEAGYAQAGAVGAADEPGWAEADVLESDVLEGEVLESDWANAVRSELRLGFNLALAAGLNAAGPGHELRRVLKLSEGLLELDPAIEDAAPELPDALEAAQA